MSNSKFGHVRRVRPLIRLINDDTCSIEGDSTAPLRSGTILLCSAMAKMTASVATYPHEVVRTRLQTLRLPIAEDLSSDGMIKTHTKRSIIYIVRKIIQKEGWTGLYKGLSVNLFRTVPNSAVTLLTCVISFEAHG